MRTHQTIVAQSQSSERLIGGGCQIALGSSLIPISHVYSAPQSILSWKQLKYIIIIQPQILAQKSTAKTMCQRLATNTNTKQ
jgi:hypothetical protein